MLNTQATAQLERSHQLQQSLFTPRPTQALPYWLAPAITAVFGLGLLLGAVVMAWGALP
jgi:hypothetical protein